MLIRNSDKIVILIPDGESGTLIHILRCLSEIRGLQIIVLSTISNIAVKHSRCISIFEYFPKSNGTREWINYINKLTAKYSVDIIMPSHESGIRRLIEFRHLLLEETSTLLPPSIDAFDLAMDKERTSKYLQKIGIPTPNFCTLAKSNPSNNVVITMNYPLLLKPTWGDGGKGIVRFENSDHLNEYLSKNEISEPCILQEFVGGTDMGFNVICKDGKILAYTIQLGTLFDDQEYMPQIGLKMVREEKVYESMCKLLKSLNWTGVAHIDLLYDIKTEKFNVLEINPRFWQTLQASSFANVNFPWLYCQTVLGRHFERPQYRKIEYLTLHGMVKKIKSNPLFAIRLNYIWRHTPIKYLIRDPAIYFFLYYNKIKRNLLNLIGY